MKLIEKKLIPSNEDYNDIYLIRWNILGQHIKLHKFILSDTECMHDHPWAFISILLKGGYREFNPSGYKDYKAPCILYRPAKWIHRLEIDETKSTWSLVINFRKIRRWGFWTNKGWIHWIDYKPTGGCDI